MAKGQIHFGKRGPEKCRADASNSRGRGCPFGATGHYSSEDEALIRYAELNRVDPEEMKALVADGCSAKDAVGLIYSGYGRDYLDAESRVQDVPDNSWSESTHAYLDAQLNAQNELQELLGSDSSVKIAGDPKSDAVTVEGSNSQLKGFTITERGGELIVDGQSDSENFRAKLQKSISGSAELQRNLRTMLTASREMVSHEEKAED